jgi:hypothetical protein
MLKVKLLYSLQDRFGKMSHPALSQIITNLLLSSLFSTRSSGAVIPVGVALNGTAADAGVLKI